MTFLIDVMTKSEGSACLALLHHPFSFGEPPALPSRPGTPDRYEGPLRCGRLPGSWNYSSGADRNAVPGGEAEFLTDTISRLQIGRQQRSPFILASGNAGPHRRNLKSKTWTA